MYHPFPSMGPSAIPRPRAEAGSHVSQLVTESLQSNSVQRVLAFIYLVDLQVNLIFCKKSLVLPVVKLLKIQMLKAS